MKKQYTLFIAFLFPFFTLAQKGQSIDFFIGYEASFRSLQSDATWSSDWIDFRNDNEASQLNFQIGANYNRQLSESIWLRTGLQLANVGYQGNNYAFLISLTGTGNQGWGDLLDQGTYNGPFTRGTDGITIIARAEEEIFNNHWLMAIPVALRFETNTQKVTPFFEFGIAPSIYLTTRQRQANSGAEISSFYNDDFNALQIVGLAAFGVNYSLGNHLELFSQLNYRRHFTLTYSVGAKEYLYNFGLSAGLRRLL